MVFELLAAGAAVGLGYLAARRVRNAYRKTRQEIAEEQYMSNYYQSQSPRSYQYGPPSYSYTDPRSSYYGSRYY